MESQERDRIRIEEAVLDIKRQLKGMENQIVECKNTNYRLSMVQAQLWILFTRAKETS
jgi:hypothetical protein